MFTDHSTELMWKEIFVAWRDKQKQRNPSGKDNIHPGILFETRNRSAAQSTAKFCLLLLESRKRQFIP
jgi:hypothetical protein